MKNPTLKRLLSLVLALTLVMSYAVLPAAADEESTTETTAETEAPHECSFTQETARTAATCGAAGSVTLACECTQTTTQEIPATGEHNYENGVCSVCRQNKPCDKTANCDAPAHDTDCLTQCTGELNCANGAHKADCLKIADCTCVAECGETKVCRLCVAGGECAGAAAAERIAAVQALINALPTQYAAEQREAAFAQYQTCTSAIEALTEAERNELDLTNYAKAAQPTVIASEVDSLDALKAALDAKATVINLNANITVTGKTNSDILLISGGVTINGNGKTITSSAPRILNIETTESVKINNLILDGDANINEQRGINVINKACNLSLSGVSVSGVSHYAVHVASTATGQGKISIENCTLTGYSALSVYPNGYVTTISGSTLTGQNNFDYGESNAYSAIKVTDNNTVTVTGGSITASTSKGNRQAIVIISGTGSTVDISKSTALTLQGNEACYVIQGAYGGNTIKLPSADTTVLANQNLKLVDDKVVPILNHEEALIAAVAAGGTITLEGDIELTKSLTIPAGKTVTLDLNGKTISQTKAQTEAYAMIYNHGTLTIQDTVGGGKISYTDSGNGGEYISDTIYNYGTLTMKSGTVENLSNATVARNGYPQALDNSDGATLYVQGGNVISTNYTAIRMFCGTTGITATISGGNITGNVDLQNVNGNANKGTLNISGGTMNHVRLVNFGTNLDNMKANISGGNITVLRCSGSTTGDQYMKKVFNITGGTFKDGETVTDVTAYLPIGYTQDSTGKVVEKNVTVQSTGTNVNVSAKIPETDKEVSENAATINNTVSVPTTDSKVQAAIAEIDGAAEATDVKVSLNLNITKYENTDGKITLTFDVAPHVQPVKVADGTTTNIGSGVELKEVDNPITFRLPMPDGNKGKIASVTHKHSESDFTTSNYVIKEENGKCYVEISTKKFSEFIVSITSAEAVALLKSTNIAYSDLGAANDAATANETIVLLKDTTIASDKVLSITENVTLDLNGKTLTGTVVGTISMNGGTYYTYDSTTSDGKYKMSAPTGSAYNSSNGVFAIATTGITIADGDVVLGWDMYTDANHTLTVSQGASFTIPAQKTLLLRNAAVVNGTLTVNGAFILEPNATVTVANNGQVNGTGSFELKTRATVVGPESLNVITNVEKSKVVYNAANKTHSVAPDYAATIGNVGYYSLAEAIDATKNSSSKTVTLEKDSVLNDNLTVTGIVIDMNHHKIQGTGSITSDGTVTIQNIGRKENAVTVLLETNDKVAFNADGYMTINANTTNTYGYDNVKITLPVTDTTTNTVKDVTFYYFLRTAGQVAGSVIISPNGGVDTSGHVLRSLNSTPSYLVNKISSTNGTSTYKYGSSETITIESNGFHSCFSDVYVNGLKLSANAYEHKEGSTIITLKNSYLKTLGIGKYQVVLTFADGNQTSADNCFYVKSAPKAACNPQTGDIILTSVVVMIAAAAGLGVLIYMGKKKKK